MHLDLLVSIAGPIARIIEDQPVLGMISRRWPLEMSILRFRRATHNRRVFVSVWRWSWGVATLSSLIIHWQREPLAYAVATRSFPLLARNLTHTHRVLGNLFHLLIDALHLGGEALQTVINIGDLSVQVDQRGLGRVVLQWCSLQ